MLCISGEAKPRRRRRKKSKGEDGGGGGGGGGFKKRKLSEEQVSMLELSFGNEHKLESERKDRLASELGLDPRQVAVWFQNRRARWKSKKLEEQYSKLKMEHDSTVVEKCRLETEVPSLSLSLSKICALINIVLLINKCIGPSSRSGLLSRLIWSNFGPLWAHPRHTTVITIVRILGLTKNVGVINKLT